MNEKIKVAIRQYCRENRLIYDMVNEDVLLFEEVSLDDVGDLIDHFKLTIKLNVKFVCSGGTDYAFKIYEE